MKYIMTLLIICLSTHVLAEGRSPEIRFQFKNTPLRYVLDDYAEKCGKHVELVEGVRANITIQDAGGVSLAEYLQIIESELRDANIGLFPISTNRLVATWIAPIYPTKDAPGSYAERRSQRLEEMRTRAAKTRSISETDVEKRLQEYNMELIRKGLTRLPSIERTQETNAQLEKKSVLPVTGTPQQDEESSNQTNGR